MCKSQNNSEVQDFIEGRNAQVGEMAEKIIETGINVLFCSREIHQPRLSRPSPPKDSMLVRRVRRSDMEALLTLRVLAL